MVETTAKFYGFLILLLAIVGIIAGEKQFLGFLNVDVALDLTRVALAVLLLSSVYGVVRGLGPQRQALLIVGLLYVGLAIYGFVDATAGGLLPDKLSLFDKLFHLITGLAALGAAGLGYSPGYEE